MEIYLFQFNYKQRNGIDCSFMFRLDWSDNYWFKSCEFSGNIIVDYRPFLDLVRQEGNLSYLLLLDGESSMGLHKKERVSTWMIKGNFGCLDKEA